MEKRVHYYVSRKNPLTWLMALGLVGSAVTRIVFACMKGTAEYSNVWSQIILPVAATFLYVLIALISGKERFYKTAIPVWLMCIHYAIIPHTFIGDDMLVKAMYWAILLLCCALYTIISSGRVHRPWFLLLIFFSGLGLSLYANHAHGVSFYEESALPDIFMFAGLILGTLAIRISPANEYHPTWGDRVDGRRIRSMPAISQITPYLMVHRCESNILFEESIEITNVDRYIRQKRREGLTNFGLVHVILTAYCRGLCKFPAMNRFIAGQKIYTHGEDIQFCMTVKKEMTVDAPDTVIKLHLNRRDTAEDVYRKFQAAVEEVKNTPLDSGVDNTAGALAMVPGVVLKFVVWLIKFLDYFGLLPKFLLEISPFHASVYFTSMGSLGIQPVYHHLYNLGNMPIFCAFGCKRKEMQLLDDGSMVQKKYVDVKLNVDERIVDGFYYAAFFKHFKRIMAHPEALDNAPEEIINDID